MNIENKRAFFDYEIIEQYESGLKLEAWEVKAIVNNTCSIAGAHCQYLSNHDAVFLMGSSIGTSEDDINRPRKLLLHRREIERLIGQTKEKGLTVVALRMYQVRGKFKLSIGVARGKKEYDKRETEKKRTIDNDLRRTVKSQKLA